MHHNATHATSIQSSSGDLLLLDATHEHVTILGGLPHLDAPTNMHTARLDTRSATWSEAMARDLIVAVLELLHEHEHFF